MKAIADVNFQTYAPLVIDDDLAERTKKKLLQYWDKTCQQLGLDYKFQPDGYLLDVDTIGTDFLINNVQFAGNMPADEITEDNVVTLGELMRSRELEKDLFQFQINPKNVEKLLMDKDHGLLTGSKLMRPIQVVNLPNSEQFVIEGGRHRLVALLTLFKVIRGYEHLQVYVTRTFAKSLTEIASLVQLSNTSRTMTRTEVSMLKASTTGGPTIFSDPAEFFARARKMTRTTDLKDLSRRLWVALLDDTQVENDTTANAIGDIGYAFTNKLCRALNNMYDKGADGILLMVRDTPKGEQQVFEALTKGAADTLVNNWKSYLQEIKEPVFTYGADRQHKVDADGNPIYRINIARNTGTIAQMLVDVLMADVADSLGQLVASQRQKAKQEKQVKAESARVAGINKTLSNLDGMAEQFKNMGISIPADLQQQMEAKRAELRTELGNTDAQPVEQDEVKAELDNLLA